MVEVGSGLTEMEIRAVAEQGLIREFHIQEDAAGFTVWLRLAGDIERDMHWITHHNRRQPRRFKNLHRLYKQILREFPRVTLLYVHCPPTP